MAEKKNQEQNEENICFLQDENGVDHKFEVIASCELNGTTYYAMIPVEDEEMNDEFCEYVILKEIEENGEFSLCEIEDDAEFNTVADAFDNLFDEEIDYDEKPQK